ncbi:MAG TPA: carbonic anhydrase family protein [Terracidiphilus sp.]|nr:carbonic anhydrase family protein [Terracidiphilus sp.]
MRIPVLAFLILGLSSALFSVVSAQDAAPSQRPWTYSGKYGPINWSKLDPAYSACSRGREQSPVDIRGARLNSELKPLQFHFIGGPVTLINDGHAIVVRPLPGSYVVIDGVRYDLQYFTFHHPSEHAVNGDLSDMEVDFLTRSADGQMAMLGVLLSENSDFPNATIATLWQHLPTTPGTQQKDDDLVNPGGLFPSDPGYWTYTGSLPEPPCTEGVQWYVFETPLPISLRQLNAFVSIFRMNTRPLQEMHGRRIQANE